MAASVVRVERGSGFSGTGFVCYADQGRCLVMTVADAVVRSRYHYVGFPNQGSEVITANLLHTNQRANLALLSFVPKAQHPCAALEFSDSMNEADLSSGPVEVRGYYLMGPRERLQAPGVFRGHISGNPVWHGDVLTLRCDYTSVDGLRGAPVIQAGRVIGVHTGIEEGRLQVATSVSTVWSTVHDWLGQPQLINNEGIYEMLESIATNPE